MLKCPELSRLPKVTRFTSILWRNQTPGSPQSVFDNSYVKLAKNASPSKFNGSSTSNAAATLLDPSHPATKIKPQHLPSWQTDGIRVKLVPMALLQKPLSQCSGVDPFIRNFVPWDERVQHAKNAGMKVVSSDLVGAQNQRIEDCELFPESELGNKRLPGHRSAPQGEIKDLELKKLARRIPMSYLTATSKERMGNKTHMRRRITTRIKTALNLIVTRGAYVDQSENIQKNGVGQLKEDESEKIKHDTSLHLSFDNEEARLMGKNWIIQGWSYIFYPTTEIYNMPFPKLVSLLRECLKSLYETAAELERRWLKEALLRQPLPRLKYQQTEPSRTNMYTREKLIKPAAEPSMHEHQVEKMWYPSSSPGPAHGVVENVQKSGPERGETPTAVELYEARLLSGLAMIKERLGKRFHPSSRSYPAEAYGVVKKPQKSRPKHVHRVESSTAVKPELWESQLLSGLAIMHERSGKRVPKRLLRSGIRIL